eukprot:2487847-Alexandrium_andersonii.AAC.1
MRQAVSRLEQHLCDKLHLDCDRARAEHCGRASGVAFKWVKPEFKHLGSGPRTTEGIRRQLKASSQLKALAGVTAQPPAMGFHHRQALLRRLRAGTHLGSFQSLGALLHHLAPDTIRHLAAA